MIGMILGNRYELLKEIGSGGMANVYLANCRLLKRNVAVKILKSEFANDKEFLERFNKEAQAAAAIQSPNIVNVYDVGHDGDIHYIVMEYVEGRTLKEYIEDNGMLSWQETAEYAAQICSALDKAHKNGIIHRDIKPQNIILTTDGILKVTDFGIARATSNETKNMGESTMGSVHYFSPEQARGGYTDAKSDIYSLGIVMYELVTGVLPFNGESPIAIAIKHMQEKPVSPKEFNISIPLAVESIILKAMSKEQSLRYQSAEEMLADLNKVLHPDIPEITEEKPTDGNTIKMEPVTPPVIKPVENDITEDKKPVNRRPVNNERDKKKRKSSDDKKAIALAVISAFVVILLALSIIGFAFSCTSSKETEIPDLTGMTYEEAVEKYGDKFEITKNDETNDEAEPKTIIRQSPQGGKMVKNNNKITVIIAIPTASFVMADFEDKEKGYFDGSMANYIDEYDLIIDVKYELNEKTEADTIIKTEPKAGETVYKGDKITVYVSKGKGVKMDKLVGMNLGEASAWLIRNNVKYKVISPANYDDSYLVEKQSIQADVMIGEDDEVQLELKAPETSSGSDTQTNPTLKSKTVYIPLPQDGRESVVLRVLQDGEQILNRRYNTSEISIAVKVTGIDSVSLQYYYDGVFAGEDKVGL